VIQLRPYQEQAIDGLRSSLAEQRRQGRKPSAILTSPTGSGKTAMAAFMASRNVARGGTLAFICHRRELVEQTSMTFESVGLHHGFIAGDYPRRASRVQICSVGTLARRVHRIQSPRVVIWDECHHVGARTWASIREAWSDAWHIGLTATPLRLDGKGLGSWFFDLVHGPSVAELMASGHLSTYDAYGPPGNVHAEGLHKRAGDFVRSEVEDALDRGAIIGGIVDRWLEHAQGRRTVVFGVTRKHSRHIAEQFVERGVRAVHIDGETPSAERRDALRAWARRDIDVVCNVELFGEGYDLAANSGDPDAVIEAAILARRTASLGLHLQQIGRALRPQDRPAIVLDHAGNIAQHGLPEDEREWSLADGYRAPDQGEGETSYRSCPECFGIVARYKPRCHLCGYVFPPPLGRKVVEVEAPLERIASGVETAEQLRLRFGGVYSLREMRQ